MDVLFSFLPILLIVIAGLYLMSRLNRRNSYTNLKLEEEAADRIRIVSDPHTDPSVLREYLAMPIPHDATFDMHIDILRALARNPALPTELQAAAINRIAIEESSFRSSKAGKGSGNSGTKGFFGVSQEFDGE